MQPICIFTLPFPKITMATSKPCDLSRSSGVFHLDLPKDFAKQTHRTAVPLSKQYIMESLVLCAAWLCNGTSSFLFCRNTHSLPSRLVSVNRALRNHPSNTNKICYFYFFKAVCFRAISGSSVLCKIPCSFQILLLHFFHNLALLFQLKLRLKIKIRNQQQCSVLPEVSRTNWHSTTV